MPTIRATYPVSIRADVVISRDFDLSREWQLAKALYELINSMDEDEAVDFLSERMTVLGEGEPFSEYANSEA